MIRRYHRERRRLDSPHQPLAHLPSRPSRASVTQIVYNNVSGDAARAPGGEPFASAHPHRSTLSTTVRPVLSEGVTTRNQRATPRAGKALAQDAPARPRESVAIRTSTATRSAA